MKTIIKLLAGAAGVLLIATLGHALHLDQTHPIFYGISIGYIVGIARAIL